MIRIGNWPQAIVLFSISFFIFFIIACGGGGSSSNDDTSPADNNLYGIWKGTIRKIEDLDAVFVLYEGDMKGTDSEGNYYSGTYTYTDGSFSATIVNSEEEMVITGSASYQNKIDATYESTTGATGAFSLNFNKDLYYRDSSFELLSGQWSSDGANFSIDTTGGITGTLTTCQLSGAFTIIDNDRNLYVLDVDLTQCEYQGQYSGLAILDDKDAQNNMLIAIFSKDNTRAFMVGYRQ
jgi:hypothetical protein